jgi:toxin HigB-1
MERHFVGYRQDYVGSQASRTGKQNPKENHKKLRCDPNISFFEGSFSPRLPMNIQRVCLCKLTQIHGAATLEFLRIPPANGLEKLGGNRKGQWSIRINDQWRICFNWKDGHAYNVEIVDYH